MSLSQHWFILLAFCCMLHPNVHSRSFSQAQLNDLSTFVNEAIHCSQAQAVSMAIVRDDHIIFNQGFNRISSTHQNLSDDQTVFCIGELTKAFTATLLAKLIDINNKSYTLDTPVRDILENDFWLSDRKRSYEMNLRDILAQKTGISNMAAITQMNSIKIENLMSHLVHAPEAFIFRERVFHSDLLFFIAEKVAEKLGDKSYEVLLSEHILKPLGMTSTTFLHELQPSRENLATPSLKINKRQYPVSIQSMRGYKLTRAANGLCSTANDVSKWLLMNLKNGVSTGRRKQIISQESLQRLFALDMDRFTESYDLIRERFLQPAVTVSFSREGYGMGWEIGTYRGYKLLTHGGSLPGYEAIISMLPNQHVGAFLAMTGTGGNEAMVIKTLISAFVLDLALNNTSWINYTNVCQVMDNLMADMERNAYLRRPHFTPHIWQKGHSSDEKHAKDENKPNLKLYAGKYQNHMFSNITINYNATTDQLSMVYGKTGYFDLERTTTKDTFLMQALGGLPYYLSHADNYKSDRYRYLYFNRTKHSKQNEGVESITIPDFDHKVHPVFKRHLKPIEREVQFDSKVSLITNGQNILRAFCALVLGSILNAFLIVALH